VGGNAQTKGMKKVAGSLRLDLAAFRELEAFAQLGTELDAATQKQVDRGYRMVELLKQPQYVPLAAADQIVSIYAGTRGYLDAVPVSQVAEAEKQLLEYVRLEHAEFREKLISSKTLDDAQEATLKTILEGFKKRWQPK
jgi:F-type H+-transporting ATPase subunit alpha